MVEVLVKIASQTACWVSGGQSAWMVWAGRPFFIKMAVSQASTAPASSSRSITPGHRRGSRSSTLAST